MPYALPRPYKALQVLLDLGTSYKREVTPFDYDVDMIFLSKTITNMELYCMGR
jgi:hypothetical protein